MSGANQIDDDDFALSPQLLLSAYAAGVFPMSEHRDDPELFWVDPRLRGVFPLDHFHLSRSLAKRMRQADYHVTLNKDFIGVVDACADRPETWINAAIRQQYIALHRLGHAHSLEIWSEDELIGGVYGVTLGAAFFGESMFSRRRDASKLALAHLIDHLNRCGFILFDTQFISDHLASLGAVEISRAAYHRQLNEAVDGRADIGRITLCTDPQSVVQRITQTS